VAPCTNFGSMETTVADDPIAGTRLAEVNGIRLCYQEFGDPGDETLLLIMGLGMQMLGWDDELCGQLADRGFHVVRFDNRDTGLSSKIGGRVNLAAGMLGSTRSAVYTLDEMAADAAGLLDHLEVEGAHVVGASMGGMIAQKLAATRPERARSLCSIMSGTGRRGISVTPRFDALRILLARPAASREDFVTRMERVFTVIGSPRYPPDRERIRRNAELSYDRCFYPPGPARQLMAVLASGNRTDEVRRIEAPTVVIHGAADRLVPPRAGRDTANAIEGAHLETIEGMGHDLPPQLWPRFVELIADNAARR
jgi:pimeloyl-ACP methyl ester carboxylesterase